MITIATTSNAHSILTAGNGNTPTHTQKDIQPCETGCHGYGNGSGLGTRMRTGR
ncbi:LOW QUALITY PROTEIN: uncharacterized protein LOC108037978 [Drosophila rhopaloa]|uniref:LOW QUALITY PROTEIN: uncharacterized protein LOC108037978 n=1 Tax=Drosophila rhopaloa TaxID=1041015 RepID=A0A6P4E4I1_DRORH|nr:LOW QUALITY PROTEIN: uncharacterized protein LOC108037978 [Drosophila rhopaloa]